MVHFGLRLQRHPNAKDNDDSVVFPRHSMAEKRAHFRLHYPVLDRPLWHYNGRTYEVIEISERGAQVRFGAGLPQRLDEPLAGKIRFSDGEEIEVAGKLLRKIDGGIVVILSKGISFRRMLVEQVHLKERYPRFFDKPLG